jgi:hypothetical protein
MYHPRGYGGFLVEDAVVSPDGQEAFVTCGDACASAEICVTARA